MKPIAVVLPMREQVSEGLAGAVALNVIEFGLLSAYRDRLLIVGATTPPSHFPLPYRSASQDRGPTLSMSWPFWRRASDRYAAAAADILIRYGSPLVEVHNRARLFRYLAKRLGQRTRMCLYLHNDPQSMEGLKSSMERSQLLQRASLVYCLSHYIRDRFVEGMATETERVVVLPNGITPLAGHQPARQKSILFVGRLIPEKGVEELFAALRRTAVQLPEWHATIIGRAPERHKRRYERALAGLKSTWGDRLVIAQALPHADVMQAYARAAITIVPSRWQEPFGRTALEALAAGSAVIASRSGGLPEIVGDAGLLLDTATPEAIERAILALARDPARREALGKAGEARVVAHFDIQRLSQRLDAWRDQLLAR